LQQLFRIAPVSGKHGHSATKAWRQSGSFAAERPADGVNQPLDGDFNVFNRFNFAKNQDELIAADTDDRI
jgi:hypothetical protein